MKKWWRVESMIFTSYLVHSCCWLSCCHHWTGTCARCCCCGCGCCCGGGSCSSLHWSSSTNITTIKVSCNQIWSAWEAQEHPHTECTPRWYSIIGFDSPGPVLILIIVHYIRWVISYFWSFDEAVPDHCSKLVRAWSKDMTKVYPDPSWSDVTSKSAVIPLSHSENQK